MKIIIFLLLFVVSLFASIGKIVSYDGDVSISRANEIYKCEVGFVILKKDLINTLKNSRVRINFNDNTKITMG
ncbi:MAG: hypothetical protein U9N59_06035 [Campylobacterota bacterium]|nr:hypothetical protein [Campylobacterota bacterium]